VLLDQNLLAATDEQPLGVTTHALTHHVVGGSVGIVLLGLDVSDSSVVGLLLDGVDDLTARIPEADLDLAALDTSGQGKP